eukprot:2385434-Pleurochrysis_carterae.AAC.2
MKFRRQLGTSRVDKIERALRARCCQPVQLQPLCTSHTDCHPKRSCGRRATALPARVSVWSERQASALTPLLCLRRSLFGAEDRSDFEYAPKVSHQRHLLVELRRLRQVCGAAEVAELEDVGSALGGGGDHLGRVDLGEAAR